MHLGQMIELDPSVSEMFEELSWDSVTRSDFHKVSTMHSTENGIQVQDSYEWTGEYERDGQPYNKLFHPRRPRTLDEHAERISKHVASVFVKCDTLDDITDKFADPAYKDMIGADINLMYSDNIQLHTVEDMFSNLMQNQMDAWLDVHPEEREKAARAKQAQNEANERQSKQKPVPWLDKDFGADNDAAYERA